jgi:hypothetical protein
MATKSDACKNESWRFESEKGCRRDEEKNENRVAVWPAVAGAGAMGAVYNREKKDK